MRARILIDGKYTQFYAMANENSGVYLFTTLLDWSNNVRVPKGMNWALIRQVKWSGAKYWKTAVSYWQMRRKVVTAKLLQRHWKFAKSSVIGRNSWFVRTHNYSALWTSSVLRFARVWIYRIIWRIVSMTYPVSKTNNTSLSVLFLILLFIWQGIMLGCWLGVTHCVGYVPSIDWTIQFDELDEVMLRQI